MKQQPNGKRRLALCLCVLLGMAALSPLTALAAILQSNPPGNTVNEITAGDTMDTNQGIVKNNRGTIASNASGGKVENNWGTITSNIMGGTVDINESGGTIVTNELNGTVNSNKGTVETNGSNGTVNSNKGTVKSNFGSISVNEEGSRVENNQSGGKVAVNNGIVDRNELGGTVENNNTLGIVSMNDGTVKDNNGQIHLNGNGGVVTTNRGTINKNAINSRVDENVEGATVTENDAGGTVVKNYGTVTNNKGTVENTSRTGHTLGQVGTNEPGGTVNNNGGRVVTNKGTVHNQQTSTGIISTVDTNASGGIIDNYDGCRVLTNESGGTVNNYNGGTVEDNKAGGTVNNYEGGIVHNKGGTVNSYGGTVHNDSGGTVITFHEVTVSGGENADITGLTDAEGKRWIQKSTGTATIRPKPGFHFKSAPTATGADVVKVSDSEYTLKSATEDVALTLDMEAEATEPVPSPNDCKIEGIRGGQTITAGEWLRFEAVGAGMDNASPNAGDLRYHPVGWKINPSGTWTGPPYTAAVNTANIAPGEHTLTITYRKEQHDGAAWQDTGETVERSVNITIRRAAAPAPLAPPSLPTHSFSRAWVFDNTHHWHECLAGDGATASYAPHDYGGWTNGAETRWRECVLCGYRQEEALPPAGQPDSGVTPNPQTGGSARPWLPAFPAALALLGCGLLLGRRKLR